MRLIGFLGGTFDPIHFGHLRIGLELQQAIALDELYYVPCADPPHKLGTSADAEQRRRMLELAISDWSGVSVDKRELQREGPSYSIDTLASIREEFGKDVSICWIIGSDSFQNLHTWHRWEALFEYAHIVVACRPGWTRDDASDMGQLLSERFIEEPHKLQQRPSGYILPWQVTQLSISATAIREMFLQAHSPRFLLPESVLTYIDQQKLYRQ